MSRDSFQIPCRLLGNKKILIYSCSCGRPTKLMFSKRTLALHERDYLKKYGENNCPCSCSCGTDPTEHYNNHYPSNYRADSRDWYALDIDFI